MGRKDSRMELTPRFEGRETLEALLSLAGSTLAAEEVLARFEQARAQGAARSEVIPSLFEREPRFPDPALAKKLYENLFGLWELVALGRPVSLDAPEPRARPEEPKAPPAPGPFGEVPDPDWVERAWQHLDGLDERATERLWHSFENRQDGLLGWLDQAGLSDNGYAQARELLFELWAMLESGWPAGLRAAEPTREPAEEAPEALSAYAEEALFEAEQDEAEPLGVDESARAKQAVAAGLAALWRARRPTTVKA